MVPAGVDIDFGGVVVDSFVEVFGKVLEKGFWSVVGGFKPKA